MSICAWGFGFCPTEDEIVEILGKKEKNAGYIHPHIKETSLYDQNPQQLYDGSEIQSGNELKWFFTKSENGNRVRRRIPNEQSWTKEGPSKDIRDSVEESSFYYIIENRRQWKMKEYKFKKLANGAPVQCALCSVHKIRERHQ